MAERIECEFLGYVIGTATGWDGELEEYTLYDFKPADKVALPSCDLTIDITKGRFKIFSDGGEEGASWDILEIMRGLT